MFFLKITNYVVYWMNIRTNKDTNEETNRRFNMSKRSEVLLKTMKEMNDSSVWGILNRKNRIIELCGDKFDVDMILFTKLYGYHSEYPQICVTIYFDQNPPKIVPFVDDPVERQNVTEAVCDWLYEEID